MAAGAPGGEIMREDAASRLYRFLFETGGTAEERAALAAVMKRRERTQSKRGGVFGTTATERALILSLWRRMPVDLLRALR